MRPRNDEDPAELENSFQTHRIFIIARIAGINAEADGLLQQVEAN